ncbi:MAG: CooT family nickel-binding protein [Methanomassiliicoccus sp.]|nr:CooT family nickel-binding protein [Methanomassiliicoccus sp.]
MCEFTVLLDSGKDRKEVARNIIKAKIKDGKVVLMDIKGKITKIDGGVITTVDTMMAEMIISGGRVQDSH